MLTIAAGGLLSGCAASPAYEGFTVVRGYTGQRANLALGRDGLDPLIGQDFAYRSEWPSAAGGLLLEDTTISFRDTYDRERTRDVLGGHFNTNRQTFRTRVIAR